MGLNTKSITVTMTTGEFIEFTGRAGRGGITPQELALELIRLYLSTDEERK